MKKREIARSKNLTEFKGKIEKEAKCLPIIMKQIIIAVVFLTFTLPISKRVLADKKTINKRVLADKKIVPGRKQATLILSDGREIVLSTSSDTIVNSKTTDVHIKIDSTGINYMIIDNKKKSSHAKSKLIKKE